MKKRLIIVLFILLPFVIGLSSSDVNYEVTKGYVTIAVNTGESYSNIIEFLHPDVKSTIAYFDCASGSCSGIKSKRVSFSDVSIIQPGNYKFVITPSSSEDRITKDFTLSLSDLKSCSYNGVYIQDGKCVFDSSGNITQKGIKCSNSLIVNDCSFCGCPDANIDICIANSGECVKTNCAKNGTVINNGNCVYPLTNSNEDKSKICVLNEIVEDCRKCGGCENGKVCCQNENLNECANNLGKCVLLSDRSLVLNITEANATVKIEESNVIVDRKEEIKIGEEVIGGCSLLGKNIPNDICVNMAIPELTPSDSYFSRECSCSTGDNPDLDGDGFDSIDFVNGRDCDDSNPLINPLAVENCGPDINNNNGIDENCDGKDLDCGFSCDRDEDNDRDSERWYCFGNDCDDGNSFKNSLIEETCGDNLDNNCDGTADENCICTPNEEKIIVGVLSNGIEKCIDGTKWETIVYPKNDPLVQFKTRNYIYEENPQASAGEEIEVLIKFYCPGGNCDVEVK